MFADHDTARIERFLEHRKRLFRLRIAAHEHVERGVTPFRPCVSTDMAFGKNGYSTDTAAFRKPVQMDMQERCSCCLHCFDQRLLDTILVVEILGVPQIDDQVTARIGQPITCDEVILAVLIPRGNRNRDGPRRSANPNGPCSIDRRHEFKSSHPGTSPLRALTPVVPLPSRIRAPLRRKRRAEGETLGHAALLRYRNRREYKGGPPPRKNFCHANVIFFWPLPQ